MGCWIIIKFFIQFRALRTFFSIIVVFFIGLSDHRVPIQLFEWKQIVDHLDEKPWRKKIPLTRKYYTIEKLLHWKLLAQRTPALKNYCKGKFNKFHLSRVHPLLTGLLLEGVAKEDELLETWQLAHEFKLFPIPGQDILK